jgi:hypothetical protein
MLYAHTWKITRADDGTAIVTYGSSSDPIIPGFSPDHPGRVVSYRDFEPTEFLLTPEQAAMEIPQEVIDDEWDRGRSAFMREVQRMAPPSTPAVRQPRSDDLAAALS